MIIGGDLNGNPIIRWTIIAEHIHEHNNDMKVLMSRSLFLSKAVTGDDINSAPGTSMPSLSKPKAPSSIGNTIYYTSTKIISQTHNHINFSSLKSRIS